MSLDPAMQRLLSSLTPGQIATFLQDTSQPRPSMKLTKNVSRGKGNKKNLVLSASVAKATRPLNSWIAFRCKC